MKQFFVLLLLLNTLNYSSNGTPGVLPKYVDIGSAAFVNDVKLGDQEFAPFLLKEGTTVPLELTFLSSKDCQSLEMNIYYLINGVELPLETQIDVGRLIALPIKAGTFVVLKYDLFVKSLGFSGNVELKIEIEGQGHTEVALKMFVEII